MHITRVMARDGNSVQFGRFGERVSHFGPESDRALEVRALSAFAFGDSIGRRIAISEIEQVPPAAQQSILASVASSWSDLSGVVRSPVAAAGPTGANSETPA